MTSGWQERHRISGDTTGSVGFKTGDLGKEKLGGGPWKTRATIEVALFV